MKISKECYLQEMRDSGYSTGDIDAFHLEMIPYLLHRYHIAKDARIVEVGIAEGHCVLTAIKAGYHNLAGVDYVDINFKRFQEQHGIDCYNVDIVQQNLPFADNSIDCYMFFHTIEHIEDATRILGEMYRTLKPGGRAFIVTPDWSKQIKVFYEDPTHIKPYVKAGLARLMRICGWQNIEMHSFGTAFGLGRLKAFKYWPKLGMIGADILAVGTK